MLGWIVIASIALLALALFRMGWRTLRGEDEFVAGGSMGHQMRSPGERKHRVREWRRLRRERSLERAVGATEVREVMRRSVDVDAVGRADLGEGINPRTDETRRPY